MAAPGRASSGWLGVAAGACLAAAISVQCARERWYPAPPPGEDVLYVPSGAVLSRMALGYDALLADIYWIRAVQYFGGQTLAQRAALTHDHLYPLLDITTTLDPYFNIAYRFGSVFVAEGAPRPGRPELAIALLEKGMRAVPERWQYPYDIAFVYYWYLQDYRRASEWFTRAGAVPGAPEWMPGLAAITAARGGDRRSARFLWRQIYETAEQQYMRVSAEHRLVQLDILDELDRLNAALERSRREGLPAGSWDALAQRGWLKRVPPTDPSGMPYVIDPGTGRATNESTLEDYPLPTDPPPQESPRTAPQVAR